MTPAAGLAISTLGKADDLALANLIFVEYVRRIAEARFAIGRPERARDRSHSARPWGSRRAPSTENVKRTQ